MRRVCSVRAVAVILLLACACFGRRESAPTARVRELMAVRRGPEVVKDRRIGPGDVVAVRVDGRSEASREYTVSRKGAIRLPRAGEVQISGQSEDEAAAAIGQALGTPTNVRLVEVTGGEATIAGAVEQPGRLRLGSKGKTLLDALAVTGGLTPDASGVIRITPGSAAPDRAPIEISAEDVLRGGENGPAGLYLRAGDRIDVLSSNGETVASNVPDPHAEFGFATADAPDDEELREREPPGETIVARRRPVAPEPAIVARPEPTRPPEDGAESERRQAELAEARAETEKARREMDLERRRNAELSSRIAELEAERRKPTPEPTPVPKQVPAPMPTRAPIPTREPMRMPTREPTPMREPVREAAPGPTREPMLQQRREPTRRPAPPRVSSPNSRIAVIGRVRSPGAQRLGEGRTVTRAVLRAGLAEGADVTRIEVRRDDGVRSSTVLVNLAEVRAGRSPDLLLEAGDTIIVP